MLNTVEDVFIFGNLINAVYVTLCTCTHMYEEQIELKADSL